MSTQLITLHGRPRAICTRRRLYLIDDTAPDTPFVLAMGMYAGAVLNGHLPGPYHQAKARAYARQLLIPAELLERHRPPLNTVATAVWLGLPAGELRIALGAHRCTPTHLAPRRDRRPCCPSHRTNT